MVRPSRSLRSASSHTASFTAPATTTNSPSPHKSLAHRVKRNSLSSKRPSIDPSATNLLSETIAGAGDRNGRNGDMLQESTGVVARPPMRLSLVNTSGALHHTINGVVTDLELPSNDVAAVANASAAIFEDAITKDKIPAPRASGKDKRVLRSQGGSSRTKSNLARFFPDFEEVVFGTTEEPDLITTDTTLFIFEPTSKVELERLQSSRVCKATSTDSQINPGQDPQSKTLLTTAKIAPSSPPDNVAIMDFTSFEAQAAAYETDPLADVTYLQAHKRGERKEKQLRNIEKEHALHEKADLERLLEELKGPDWLKTMGISGVTEMERKKFEPHRNQYIQRGKALLEKFSLWKEQERELKLRREEALLAKEEAEEEDEVEEEEEEELEGHKEDSFAENRSYSSDLADASARQLQLEARSAYNPMSRARIRTSRTYLPLPDPEPDEPFVSFYSKPHLRVAAMGSHRRGRLVTAFGQPIPQVAEQEFALPDDYVTEETVIANARKRRRLKRESNIDASGSKKMT